MLTETLRRVLVQIEQLSPEAQDALAAAIEQELAEREWEVLVSQPESARFLDQLAAEARRDDAAGRTQKATDRW